MLRGTVLWLGEDRYCCFLLLLRKDLEKRAAWNQNTSFHQLKKKLSDSLNF